MVLCTFPNVLMCVELQTAAAHLSVSIMKDAINFWSMTLSYSTAETGKERGTEGRSRRGKTKEKEREEVK